MTSITTERIESIAQLAGTDAATVEEYINGDWSNQDEHQAWMQTATDQDIANWVKDCLR